MIGADLSFVMVGRSLTVANGFSPLMRKTDIVIAENGLNASALSADPWGEGWGVTRSTRFL